MDKQICTVGVFIGITDKNSGKLLLFRREDKSSLFGVDYSGKWELPGGSVRHEDKIDYDELTAQLQKRVDEKLGIKIQFDDSPLLWRSLTVKTNYGFDIAMITCLSANVTPSKGDYAWVSFKDIQEIVLNDHIIGGYGKRQHKMALMALSESCNPKYKLEAVKALKKL